MAYVPLIAALLDQAGCQSCRDFDDWVYERRQALSVESGQSRGSTPHADLIISIDALEDLSPHEVDGALDEIARMTGRLALIVVHRTPANAAAGDPVRWLLEKVGARFDLVHFQDCEKGFLVLACPAGDYARLDAEIDLAALARTAAQLAPQAARSQTVGRWLEAAKQGVEVRWLAFWDDRTPRLIKLMAVLACVLALSPIDLTPDVIPSVGYLDDLAFLGLATVLVSRLLSAELLADLRLRAASIDHVRAVRGSFAIGSIWVAAVMVTALHAMRPVI